MPVSGILVKKKKCVIRSIGDQAGEPMDAWMTVGLPYPKTRTSLTCM